MVRVWRRHVRSVALLALAASCAAAVALTACKHEPAGDADAAASGDLEAGVEVAIAMPDAGASDGGGPSYPMIHALGLITPVMSAPEWAPHDPSKASEDRKGVVRLGYLRRGDVAAVKPTIIKKQSCLEGWFELLPLPGAPAGSTGGYVCGKYATLTPDEKETAAAPHPPNMAGPLPYEYGLNLVNGAPLYRRPLLRRERADLERGLAVGKKFRKKDGDDSSTSPQPVADKGGGDTPWYLAHHDKSQVSMDDLKGETSLIDKRMVKGFYLALDTNIHAFAGNFWRTTRGMFVPKEHILVHDPKVEFEGVWMAGPSMKPGETRHLPLAWITNPHQWKYSVDEADGKVHRHDHVDRFTIVQLTGKKATVENKKYWETDEGWWMRDMDGTVVTSDTVQKRTPGVGANEKWIDVNLSRQSLVAFEGDKPVFATIISSGRHNDEDPAKDHRTRPGEFRVREKHISATMDNDTATDGPYSIEDVPWIMYFDGSTALHGAFWHSKFGHERSHGCVNMTPHDAHEMFGWVGPVLPEGWHGVKATDANPGTWVFVHDDGKTAAESKEARRAKDDGPSANASEDGKSAAAKHEPGETSETKENEGEGTQ